LRSTAAKLPPSDGHRAATFARGPSQLHSDCRPCFRHAPRRPSPISEQLSAIHGCFASALTLIASEVAERAKVPLLTGSSSDQLNKGRRLYLTPFAPRLAIRAGAAADVEAGGRQAESGCHLREYRIRHLTSNGLRGAGTRPKASRSSCSSILGRFTDASPLINKVKASGANALFSVSYHERPHPDRAHGQAGRPHIAINGAPAARHSRFLQERRKLAEGLQGVAHWNHRHGRPAPESERRIQEAHRRVSLRVCRGLVAQTS